MFFCYLPEFFPPLCGSDDGEHHLRDVEGVPPVVVSDVAVVLPDGAEPATQHSVVNVEATGEIQVDEHAKGSLEREEENMELNCCRQNVTLLRVPSPKNLGGHFTI